MNTITATAEYKHEEERPSKYENLNPFLEALQNTQDEDQQNELIIKIWEEVITNEDDSFDITIDELDFLINKARGKEPPIIKAREYHGFERLYRKNELLFSILSFIGIALWGVCFYKFVAPLNIFIRLFFVSYSVFCIASALICEGYSYWHPKPGIEMSICVWLWAGLIVAKPFF